MSSMAKIFVVVNLVFGILCFGAAATLLGASDDYKGAYEKELSAHKATKQTDAQQITQLELTASQQQMKAVEQNSRADGLQNQKEELQTSLTNAEAANQALRSSNESFSKNLGELKDLVAAQQAFLDKLSGENKTATEQMLSSRAQWEKEVANRVGLEQQVSELNEQMSTLSASNGDLDRRLKQAEFYLGIYKQRYGPITPPEGAPGVLNGLRGNQGYRQHQAQKSSHGPARIAQREVRGTVLVASCATTPNARRFAIASSPAFACCSSASIRASDRR